MPKVNPEILLWARETAGLSLEEAASKIRLGAARGQSAPERLAAMEAGEEEPTRAMLSKMSTVYRRPLLIFYLSGPPPVAERGQDFRTLPEGEEDRIAEPILDALIRNVRTRQGMVRSVLEDDEDTMPLPYVGSMQLADGVERVRESIRSVLGLDLAEFRSARNPADAFGRLRRAAEDAGIFVLLKGDLGSYHTALDTDTFRGFALADEIAPFVVINPADSRAAWSFTLLHELAHIWLGLTGVSNSRPPELRVEQFCNDVASTYLLPEEEMSILVKEVTEETEDLATAVGRFAQQRHLSGSLCAYRLYRSGVFDAGTWARLRTYYRDAWFAHRTKVRDRAKRTDRGPDYYTIRRHRVGTALVDLVRRTMRAGDLSTTRAGRVLGVRPKKVADMLTR